MTDALECRLATGLGDALTLRRLRNGCASSMTNARDPIGRWAQIRWYFGHYRAAATDGSYRVFLFSEGRRDIGYGALKLHHGELLVTECVDTGCRGRGVGKRILHRLIELAADEKRDLIAEIWASNEASIALHRSAGFRLEKTVDHQGADLDVYALRCS